jgi:hypothetical protein
LARPPGALTMTLVPAGRVVEVEAPPPVVGAHGGQAGPTRGVRAVSTAAGISTLAAVVGSVA